MKYSEIEALGANSPTRYETPKTPMKNIPMGAGSLPTRKRMEIRARRVA